MHDLALVSWLAGARGKEGDTSRTRKPRRATKEREPPRQMGSIAISNGPYLDPISTHICAVATVISKADAHTYLQKWDMAHLVSCILNR